jgi:hypothetical protein
MTLKLASSRSVVVGYGTDEGAITLGGLSNQGFSILASDVLDTYTTFSFVALIQVIGRGAGNNTRAVDFNKKISALKNLVRYSGNFCYQTDVDRSFANLTVANVSGVTNTATIQDVAATGQFTANDIGRVAEVEDVGAFQILTFQDSNNVTVKLTPEIDLPPAAVTKAGRIGTESFLFRDTDKKGAFYARPTLQRVENTGDRKYRKTYLWTVVSIREANSDKDAGRQDARITVVTNPGTNLRAVTLSGVYTALNTGTGTFNDAVATHNAGVGTWATSVLAKFGGVSNYELVANQVSPDDEFASLVFSRTYVEKKNPDVTVPSGLNDTRITNQNLVITRRANWMFGLANRFAPIHVQLSWNAEIDSTQIASSGLTDFYLQTIKPALLTLVQTEFGSKPTLDTELGTINRDGFTISVNMSLYIPNAKDRSLYLFTKTASYGLSTRKDTRDRWDTRSYSFTRFSPGFLIKGSTDVRVIRRGLAKHSGVAKLGYAPVPPSSGNSVSSADSDAFQAPGTPPFGGLNGNAQWLLENAAVVHTPFFRGNDLEGDSNEQQFTDSTYQTSWLWGREVVDKVVASQPTSSSGGSGSTAGVGVGLGGGAGLFGPSGIPRTPPSGRLIPLPGEPFGGGGIPSGATGRRLRLPFPAGQLGGQ